MPKRVSPTTGSELFIVDNSDTEWKVSTYLHKWCGYSKSIDIATGNFEIGGLLVLKDEWQKVDKIRILMGGEVSARTKTAFEQGLQSKAAFNEALQIITDTLDKSIEDEKEKNDFLAGLPAIVAAIRSRKIECRVYRKEKFHAKAYITHAREEVIGSFGLVGSSNFSLPGLTQNIELNVQITGGPVTVLQEWYDEHWKEADDVTPDILRVMERQMREYSPFEVYAKALHELFLNASPNESKWEEKNSRMFHVLDGYQQDGYHNLLRIVADHGGALLCDGVGLGKTFVGLMLIERLIVRDGRNVILLAPKGALESVWKPAIKKYLKKLSGGAFSNLFVASHTDLGRESMRELFEAARDRAHVIVIDEAHHFRNPGAAGTGLPFGADAPKQAQQGAQLLAKRSRYRELYDLAMNADGRCKQLFLLTATPINNSFHDLRHMIELFTQKQEDYFGSRLGIHSLTRHFNEMEKRLDRAVVGGDMPITDSEEAKEILAADKLVSALVVQRSRVFVKEKQIKAGAPVTDFPPREPPQRAEYSLEKVYGRLLAKLEAAFDKNTPLFILPMYYPLAYPKKLKGIGPGEENRQKQVVALIRTSFLKRFESSVEAFRRSCERLVIRLLMWAEAQSQSADEKRMMSDWRETNIKLIENVRRRQPELFGTGTDAEDNDEDLFEEELLEDIKELKREQYDVPKMLAETFSDLDQLADFFPELDKFDHRNDDKLKKLLKMLTQDPVLSEHKVLIFTEFSDTADYLLERLTAAKISGVERIDSRTKGKDRLSVIRRFSPYYNNSSSKELENDGENEIRVLISTDVLSEGLNLQDASRLINYDLHWNPVRLMQRIGRIDRRRNGDNELNLSTDHPATVEARKSIVYYNFLPPGEINHLLTLYSKVTRKTLRISKALGIEGKKLLREDDDFQDLKHFNESYEGKKSATELLELERDELFKSDPLLKAKLEAMPLRVFSGKLHPKPGTRAVFFCYRMPLLKDEEWTTGGGLVQWYLYDLAADKPIESAPAIAEYIRSTPATPRRCVIEPKTLGEIRAKVEKYLKDDFLKRLQVPTSVKPVLVAWMELTE